MLRLLAFTLKVTIALPIAALIVAGLLACLAVKVLPRTPDPKRVRVRRTAVEDAEGADDITAAAWVSARAEPALEARRSARR